MTTYVGTLGNDSHSGIDDVMYGLDGNDSLDATGQGQTIYGGEGVDNLTGGNASGRAAVMFGGNGNDVLLGTGFLYGDVGDDFVGDIGLGAAFGGDGNDTLNVGLDGSAGGVAYGGGGNDFLEGATIYWDGGTGNDIMWGSYSLLGIPSVLEGGDGDDVIVMPSFEAGNDGSLIYGGLGNDMLYGGTQNDTMIGDDGADLLEGGDGNDWLYLGTSNGTNGYGGAGNDVLIATRGAAVENGDDGNDVMYGNVGNDYFYGGNGDDTMYGGDGVDVLLGGAGNDYFDGGSGVNYYFGSGGNNIFVSNDVPGVQVIQDWNSATDTVLLNGTGFASFADVLSHSYQNGAYFVVQVDGDTAVWLNGATASTLTAANFSIAS